MRWHTAVHLVVCENYRPLHTGQVHYLQAVLRTIPFNYKEGNRAASKVRGRRAGPGGAGWAGAVLSTFSPSTVAAPRVGRTVAGVIANRVRAAGRSQELPSVAGRLRCLLRGTRASLFGNSNRKANNASMRVAPRPRGRESRFVQPLGSPAFRKNIFPTKANRLWFS
jgi:hypothetical protein